MAARWVASPARPGGVAHMNSLGLSWSREQFLWNTLRGYSPPALPTIATDRNFRGHQGDYWAAPDSHRRMRAGGLYAPAKYNPPQGLHLPASHSRNHFGQFVRGIVESRKPTARGIHGFGAEPHQPLDSVE